MFEIRHEVVSPFFLLSDLVRQLLSRLPFYGTIQVAGALEEPLAEPVSTA